MSIISTPTRNQIITDPAQGRGLRCAGKWLEKEEVENTHGASETIIFPRRNEDLIVTLIQPNTANQVLNTKTNAEGGWSVSFPACKPGPARVIVEGDGTQLDEVQFRVAPNQRQPLTVRLDGVDASTNPVIDLPEDGKNLQVEIRTASPTRTIRVQIRVRGDMLPLQERSSQTPVSVWTFTLNLPGRYAPAGPVLIVEDTDFFGVTTPTGFNFTTTDTRIPKITISEPAEDQVFAAEQISSANPLKLVVRGTVRDMQSGYKDGTLTYSFAGQTNVGVAVANGDWAFELAVTSFGQYELTMTAMDAAGNTLPRMAVRQFEVVSSYKPKSIEELLGPTAYLSELLRFARSHLLTQDGAMGAAVDAVVLTAAFKQPFGDIAQPNAPAAQRQVSDLLTPTRILRDVKTQDTAGLIARWTFSELAHRAPDGLRDRAGLFGVNGSYHGVGSYADVVERMRGKPGTDFEGAVVLDGNSFAEVASRPVLEVGRDNRDFTVSFWIYPNDTGSGTWRQVLYKGHEPTWPTNVNRTFGIWLHPNSNTVHFRITTAGNPNDGGDSKTKLPARRWSHLAYVKSEGMLRLYINGRLDAEVQLAGDTIANADPIFIGKSPFFDSFRGGLAEVRLYGFALRSEAIEQLALDRRAGLTATPVADYHEAVYEALLVGLGTSLEEFRGLNALSAAQRRALAERLGLLTAGTTGDTLDSLLPNFLPGTDEFEFWLAGTFGLPLTFTPRNPSQAQDGFVFLVWARRESLAYQWALEDAQQARPPELDPDLIDLADLSPTSLEWVRLLRSRGAELAVQFESFDALLRAGSAANALSQVYPANELIELKELSDSEKAGEPIAQKLPRFNLDRTMFRRLLAYMGRLTTALTAHERVDFAHLLTQLWKVRTRYTAWKQEEAALGSRLWPTLAAEAAWVPGSYKRDFQPWRGDVQQRADLEARLAGRLRAWQSIQDAQEHAVAEAQRTALPLLRDGLLGIGDLPSASQRMDDLTERWLVDFAATSATFVTPVEQATLSLQTLVNSIRNGWYEARHVAHGWTIKTEYRAEFDAEWQWLGTYGSWRAAVLSYLYPENMLFPDLRKLRPGGATSAFITFLGELRKLQPLTSSSLSTPPPAYLAAKNALVVADESQYFAPVAIALALQRAGLYSAALDEYRNVYDPSRSGAARKRVQWLRTPNENDAQPPAPFFDDRWTLALTDPHAVALLKDNNGNRVWGNPYTRYTLIQIVHCLLAQADGEFAAGTRDARAKALSLYLEAKEILAFDELRDLQPARPEQAYLPNPVLAAQRAHVDVALRKLRRGLSFLGTPLPPDVTRGPNAGSVSSLVRPIPYRFKVLMERAKQLAAQAQQFESQYLSAIERGEVEAEKLMRENFVSEIAGQTVTLRQLGEREAKTGKAMAELQRTRSQIQADRYQSWLSAGPSENERTQIEMLWRAKTARDVVAGLDAALTASQAAQSAISAGPMWWAWIGAAATSNFAIAKGVAQGFLNDYDTRAQTSGILGTQERRAQEWQLQRDLSQQDVLIGNQQVAAAEDRVAIAAQESVIASTQLDQAHQMLAFLTNKFTSAEFYQWLTGVLSEVYAFFLRTAASNAQQAELQLAFERQEAPARLIKPDYWLAASQPSTGKNPDSAPDRRGISGSARLLQDLYTLDQQAFSSERRLLNLTQSFPLSRLMPIEFEEFRRTGLLAFSTPMQWFDEGFPGHYMRLIKRVRISVAALIPPSQGIRATLTNGGLSRIVTADPGHPTVVVCQAPQSVALTSPVAATGVFELDTQSDLLFPFEGTGVDTTWFFELPPAGNPFDFDTLAEAVLTVEYSALMSYELRDRVVKKLPRRWSGDRSFSVRRDLPDVWYELSNPSQEGAPSIELVLDARAFPAGISNLSIDEVALSVRLRDGAYPMVAVLPTFIPSGSATPVVGAQSALVKGLVSSIQSGASSWGALRGTAGTAARWKFQLADVPASDFSLREAFHESNVDDITIVFTVSGMRPAWSV